MHGMLLLPAGIGFFVPPATSWKRSTFVATVAPDTNQLMPNEGTQASILRFQFLNRLTEEHRFVSKSVWLTINLKAESAK